MEKITTNKDDFRLDSNCRMRLNWQVSAYQFDMFYGELSLCWRLGAIIYWSFVSGDEMIGEVYE